MKQRGHILHFHVASLRFPGMCESHFKWRLASVKTLHFLISMWGDTEVYMSSIVTPASWWEDKKRGWCNKQMQQQGSASAENIRICYQASMWLFEWRLGNRCSVSPIQNTRGGNQLDAFFCTHAQEKLKVFFKSFYFILPFFFTQLQLPFLTPSAHQISRAPESNPPRDR